VNSWFIISNTVLLFRLEESVSRKQIYRITGGTATDTKTVTTIAAKIKPLSAANPSVRTARTRATSEVSRTPNRASIPPSPEPARLC
jgi:hypothetical protein